MLKRALLFGCVAAITAYTLLAGAQGRRGSRAAAKEEAGAPLAAKGDTLVPTRDGGAERSGVVDQKTLDGGAHVFRFGEVEVEGRLRNPQIVYFLRRVRAEFSAGDLGHRSFIRELEETKTEPAF